MSENPLTSFSFINLFHRTQATNKIIRKLHVLKVFHRTERPVALTTAHTDAHNTKHNKQMSNSLTEQISSDRLKQSNEVQSTESRRRIQRLINLSLKKRRACGATKTSVQFKRMTSGARWRQLKEIHRLNKVHWRPASTTSHFYCCPCTISPH